jgi:DNA-binding transcriptional ArsR family regulator
MDDGQVMPAVQRISDSGVLAAMAHPLRRRLLAVLSVDGPMAVGMLAEATGQAAGNVSHHMRALGAARLVVEVPELARDKRERWWRRASRSIRWSSEDFGDDATAETIADAAESINRGYQEQVLDQWLAADHATRVTWPTGPFSTDTWLRLTDAELHELGEEVIALTTRWADRVVPDDGEDRRTVLLYARGVPGRP